MTDEPAYYGLDHPNPHYIQLRPRRQEYSGSVAVHTVEIAEDDIGEDWGAENSARAISNRSDGHGSYTKITDFDSIVDYAPVVTHATFHTPGHNDHMAGVSVATSAHQWDADDPRDQQRIWMAGRAIGDCMLARWPNPTEAARHVRIMSVADAEAARAGDHSRSGIIFHGHLQPPGSAAAARWGVRTDPWVGHPHEARLTRMLLQATTSYLLGRLVTDPTPPQEDDMGEITHPDQRHQLATAADIAERDSPRIKDTQDRVARLERKLDAHDDQLDRVEEKLDRLLADGD